VIPLSEDLARKVIEQNEITEVGSSDQASSTNNVSVKETSCLKPNGHDLSNFENHPGYKLLQKRKADALAKNISIPFFPTNTGANNNNVVIDGRELINFSGYNYLGLSGHPYVSEAAKSAIDQFGTSVSASRIVSGQIPLHLQLEKTITDFLGVEDCLAFVSGYNTNVTTLGHLLGRKDLVLHDHMAHNSILTGCNLTNANRMSFPRNDWDRLEQILGDCRTHYQRVIIVIEGTYSMDGNIPDLIRAIAIKKKYDAFLMVDEAHSLGVIGEKGGGIGEHHGIDRREVDIWMGSLSKTFASCGGFIAGSAALVDYLKYSAPGFIFSVGLSPPDTASAIAAFEILKREPGRVKRLRENTQYFLALAAKAGLDTGMNNGAPVVPVVVGDAHRCMKLSKRLFEIGIHVQPIIYPAVAHDDARLRFFVTSMHSHEEIEFTVMNLAKELSQLSD